MFNLLDRYGDRPGLLISVRSAAEAQIALAGGADVIDVKEPKRGSLGAADAAVVKAIVAVVAGRLPVSVAAGEILHGAESCRSNPNSVDGVSFVKFGLAGCSTRDDWAPRWRSAISRQPQCVQPVAVVYADWCASSAPAPDDVLRLAQAIGCPALVVDTWNKSRGTLFDHWPVAELCQFCDRVRAARLAVVLAGSLSCGDVDVAMECHPHLIAVRGAVCLGGRSGPISLARIRTLRAAIDGDRGPSEALSIAHAPIF